MFWDVRTTCAVVFTAQSREKRERFGSTAVFIGRDNDPRKIRERAAEDGRHGEEALRKLARLGNAP
jgi:hypothetical protein